MKPESLYLENLQAQAFKRALRVNPLSTVDSYLSDGRISYNSWNFAQTLISKDAPEGQAAINKIELHLLMNNTGEYVNEIGRNAERELDESADDDNYHSHRRLPVDAYTLDQLKAARARVETLYVGFEGYAKDGADILMSLLDTTISLRNSKEKVVAA